MQHNEQEEQSITPMMQQYLAIKAEHADYMLFYRMGDFYELFFEDAVKASEILDIALTKRGKHKGQDIPMCGVPCVSSESYLEKLIKSGQKIAICEQTEDPKDAKKRGYKAVVNREVVRIVTAGTITEENILDSRATNYLCFLNQYEDKVAIAWVDITTGEFKLKSIHENMLMSELYRLSPREIVIPDDLAKSVIPSDDWSDKISYLAREAVNNNRALARIEEAFEANLGSIKENFSINEIIALGGVIEYIKLTQKGALPHLVVPEREITSEYMLIDPSTRRNLEITSTFSGERKGSLLSVIDKTVTACGSRLLLKRLASPITSVAKINNRLDVVGEFFNEESLRMNARKLLRAFPDAERALSRISLNRSSPRDLGIIRDALKAALSLKEYIITSTRADSNLYKLAFQIGNHDELYQKLADALKQELGIFARDGNFIVDGYNAVLDEFRTLRDDSKRLMSEMQMRLQNTTGIQSLKIKHNNILGYFIETTAIHKDKIPDSFIHRQTMAGAMRFTCLELKDLEGKINQSAERALAIELQIFSELLSDIQQETVRIIKTSEVIAEIDVSASLAEVAADNRFVRPIIDDSCAFNIKSGRHPVVEHFMRKSGGRKSFTSNDCTLQDSDKLWLLTGPNMAGKSTFLRQNAIISLLAHVGSFVPAEYAHIGVMDRLYSRVGASDDLAKGQSTFMVEMLETATILNSATDRSFVILDEIGRGTATFDGLSIAWAVTEHLHNKIKCRAIFATHYHELTALEARLHSMKCHNMKVKEWKGEVIFMHEVVKGAADRSYGIHVAELAGLPREVIANAKSILATLEKEYALSPAKILFDGLPLFQDSQSKNVENQEGNNNHNNQSLAILDKIREINPDSLSPKQALDILYEIKAAIDS